MSKSTEYKLLAIRQHNLITDYLTSKGHKPVKDMGDRLMYLCPIHKDSMPSFIVYLESDEKAYQEYYCFGCKSSHCIIELYSKVEGVDWRVAISQLGLELDITDQDEIGHIVNSLKKQVENGQVSYSSDLMGESSIHIGIMGRLYLQKVNYDEKELEMLENLYKKIDICIQQENVAELLDIYDMLIDGIAVSGERVNLFLSRYDQWKRRQDDDLKEGLRAYDKI